MGTEIVTGIKGRVRNKDASTYRGYDSGCIEATNKLGYQSNCFQCPFPECVFDRGKGRAGRPRSAAIESRNRFISRSSEYIPVPTLACMLELEIRWVYEILRRERNAFKG